MSCIAVREKYRISGVDDGKIEPQDEAANCNAVGVEELLEGSNDTVFALIGELVHKTYISKNMLALIHTNTVSRRYVWTSGASSFYTY